MSLESYFGEIVQSIKTYPVTLFKAPTGTGKSTRLPTYLLEQEAFRKCRITTVIPIINGVKGIKRFLSQNGPKHNYQFQRQYHKGETKLTFSTSGTLLAKLLGRFGEGSEDPLSEIAEIVIVDECHSTDDDTALLLKILSYIYRKDVSTRLILMSATPDMYQLEQMFPDLNSVIVQDVPSPFPRKIKFIENNEDIEDTVVGIVASKLSKNWSWLIFADGIETIDKIFVQLKGVANIPIHICHSSLSDEEQEAALNPPSSPFIIIATNCLESSVTLSIDAVIDTCDRRCRISKDGVSQGKLTTVPISELESTQRWGRCGRIREGHVFVTCEESYFEKYMRGPRPTTFDNTCLVQPVARLIKAGLDPVEILDIREPERVENCVHYLHEIGILTPENTISEMGEFCLKLPVYVNNARLIYFTQNNPAAIALVCCMEIFSNKTFVYFPRYSGDDKQKIVDHIQDNYSSFFGHDEMETYLNIFYACYTAKTSLFKFCKANALQFKVVVGVMSLFKRILSILNVKMDGPFEISPIRSKFLEIFQKNHLEHFRDRNGKDFYLGSKGERYFFKRETWLMNYGQELPKRICPAIFSSSLSRRGYHVLNFFNMIVRED